MFHKTDYLYLWILKSKIIVANLWEKERIQVFILGGDDDRKRTYEETNNLLTI